MLTTESTSGEGAVQKHQHQETPKVAQGLEFERLYTTAGVDPFDEIEWETRDARISNEKGDVIFEQLAVGGRMAIPVGQAFQDLLLLRRTEEGVERTVLMGVRFVPMRHGESE